MKALPTGRAPEARDVRLASLSFPPVSTPASGVADTATDADTLPLLTPNEGKPDDELNPNWNPVRLVALTEARALRLSMPRKNPASLPNEKSSPTDAWTLTDGAAPLNAAPNTLPRTFCNANVAAVGRNSRFTSHDMGSVLRLP